MTPEAWAVLVGLAFLATSVVWFLLGPHREAQRLLARVRAQRDGRDRAYIVGTLDVRCTPPRVVAVHLFSAEAANITGQIGGGQFKFDIASVDGDSYAEARQRAEYALETQPWLSWALVLYKHPWPKRDRA